MIETSTPKQQRLGRLALIARGRGHAARLGLLNGGYKRGLLGMASAIGKRATSLWLCGQRAQHPSGSEIIGGFYMQQGRGFALCLALEHPDS
jgi:hypothetical protein